jgi:hypothetical protein
MPKAKKGKVEIHDAKRIVDKKVVMAYRVKTIAANGEPLQVSEVLNTYSAVMTHIKAMCKVFSDWDLKSPLPVQVIDMTKKKAFLKYLKF